MASLPYVTATGNVEKAFKGIQAAATPERVSQDFVKTILHIGGGSGSQMTSYLKKIGFANSDGTPSEIYKRFRNPTTAGRAAVEALKTGYAPLYVRNEYMHKLPDDQLKGLIIEETGQGNESSVVSLILSCIKTIKKYADWSTEDKQKVDDSGKSLSRSEEDSPKQTGKDLSKKVGLNLSYTINLNLPATSDVAVFNAIFKSLKENLLRASNE